MNVSRVSNRHAEMPPERQYARINEKIEVHNASLGQKMEFRRARSAAAREADFDEHRADVRSFGGNGHDHREYDYRGG